MKKKLTPQEKADKAYEQILRMGELNRKLKRILSKPVKETEQKPTREWKLTYQGLTSKECPTAEHSSLCQFSVKLNTYDNKKYRVTVEYLEEVKDDQ